MSGTRLVVWSAILSQIALKVSLFVSLSKIPSQPIKKKSKLSLSLKLVISGSHTTTLGLPLYLIFFASMSPNVLDTLKRPGNTLNGP